MTQDKPAIRFVYCVTACGAKFPVFYEKAPVIYVFTFYITCTSRLHSPTNVHTHLQTYTLTLTHTHTLTLTRAQHTQTHAHTYNTKYAQISSKHTIVFNENNAYRIF